MVPIYEQIIAQIKAAVLSGELGPDDMLPSVRALSKELKISALTVKKAYDRLEEEGCIVTVHGKGSFVSGSGTDLLAEERRKDVEADLEKAVQKRKAVRHVAIGRSEISSICFWRNDRGFRKNGRGGSPAEHRSASQTPVAR